MINFEALDPKVPIHAQLGADAAPVVLVNLFAVDPADTDALLAAWEHDANWMKRQPGYISTQLHRAIGGSSMFLNYAVWESVAQFRAAFMHPEFKTALSAYPSSVVTRPHLFTRVAVTNLCTT